MAQELSDLQVLEVSLVDNPANAEVDPVTGRKVSRARIALYKRDDTDRFAAVVKRCAAVSEEIAELQAERAEENAMRSQLLKAYSATATDNDEDDMNKKKKGKKKFQKILKSGTATRADIVEAVEKRAVKIAKRENISEALAQAHVWADNPEMVELYEKTAKGEPKRAEPKMRRAVPADAELDKRARKMMKDSPGMNYATACTKVLEKDPGLYKQYESEMAKGSYPVPDDTADDDVSGPRVVPHVP
jgi:hypothetical protein